MIFVSPVSILLISKRHPLAIPWHRFVSAMFLNNIIVIAFKIILDSQFCFIGCAHIMKQVNVNLTDSMTLECSHHRCRSPLHQASLCIQNPRCLASWAPEDGGQDCLICACPYELPGSITTGAVAQFYILENEEIIPGNYSRVPFKRGPIW